MPRILFGTLVLLLPIVVRAETPRFKFTKGEMLSYRLVQTTKTIETLIDEQTKKPADQEHTMKVDVLRHWKVTEVDDKGIGTLEMTITSMRFEQKLPNGDMDVFDSAKPDELNKSEMAKNVGPVLAVVRIDPQGQLVEVKQSKIGNAERFQIDLPFKLTLPTTEVKQGSTWDRTFTIQLDPPFGTGEKYATTQKYTVQEPKSGLLTLALATTVKELPTQAADQIPLLPKLAEGTLYFDASTGRYYAARLKIQKELTNHQGEGSKYQFTSTYVEDLVPRSR